MDNLVDAVEQLIMGLSSCSIVVKCLCVGTPSAYQRLFNYDSNSTCLEKFEQCVHNVQCTSFIPATDSIWPHSRAPPGFVSKLNMYDGR